MTRRVAVYRRPPGSMSSPPPTEAVPATVSGEERSKVPLASPVKVSREGGLFQRPGSQETCLDRVVHLRSGIASEGRVVLPEQWRRVLTTHHWSCQCDRRPA